MTFTAEPESTAKCDFSARNPSAAQACHSRSLGVQQLHVFTKQQLWVLSGPPTGSSPTVGARSSPVTLNLGGTCLPERNHISSSPSPSLPDASFSCEEVWTPESFLQVQRWGHNSACLSARKTSWLTPLILGHSTEMPNLIPGTAPASDGAIQE